MFAGALFLAAMDATVVIPVFVGFVDYINVSGIPGTGYNIIGRSPN